MSGFGSVLGGSNPNEAKTNLHLTRAVVGKEKKVKITAFASAGERFPVGGERVEVKLLIWDSDDPPLIAEITDNNDGTYIASFTPQEVGQHPLSITFDNVRIKGSPFQLHVRQERDYTTPLSCQFTFKLSAQPYDVAVDDSDGFVYVAVYGGHCIEVYDRSGGHIRTIGTSGICGSGRGQFNAPSAIAIRDCTLYIADSNNNHVQKINKWGDFLSQFGSNYLVNPRGICLDKDERIFVSSCGNSRVCVFEADGTHIRDILGSASDGSNLSGPWGLAIDCSGNLHVADSNTNTIKVFTPQGQHVISYSSGVSQPAGIAVDDEGYTFTGENSYSSNTGLSRLCISNSQHQVVNSPQLVEQACGVTVDSKGSIYICDCNNCCIYKY